MNSTMIIRSKSFEAWYDANLREFSQDIASQGANSGFPGITYYRDTCKLYDKFHDEIWEALWEDAWAFGQSVLEMIATFRGAKDVGGDEQFKNLMVWYMAERIANREADK